MKERFCCGPKSKKVTPSVSAPLHLILQAPSPASHEWKKVPGVKRLCQLCHLTVDGQGVRCKSCGLSAHPQCGTYYPANNNPGTSAHHPSHNPFNASNNLVTTAAGHKGSLLQVPSHSTAGNRNSNFEPRIKKLLHVSIPVPPPHSVQSDHSHSTRLSSCGDSSAAASTAIAVGTATVSTETPRSESKTPETTITPGSGVVEDPSSDDRALQLPDSGCAGLLDRDGATTAEETDGFSQNSQHIQRGGLQGHYSRPGSSQSKVKEPRHIRYVDGPLDGALYALVNPIKTKAPSSADSGISVTQVDQMKDLDRLLNALVQDAESIPDIPYHAREDSLPFSYGVPGQAALKHRQEQQERLAQQQEVRQQSAYQPRYTTSSTYSPTSPAFTAKPQQPPNSAPAHLSHSHRNFPRQTSRDSDTVFLEDFPDSSPYARPERSRSSSQVEKVVSQSQAPRVHNLRLDLDDQTPPSKPALGGFGQRSLSQRSHDYNYGSTSRDYGSTRSYHSPVTSEPIRRYQPDIKENSYGESTHFHSPPPQQPPSSLSFNNFGSVYGNNNNVGKRIRSQSADGRRQQDRDEDADQWLARQMQRLQEKKARKYPVKNDWLAELKRALPNEKTLERSNHVIRPSSSTRLHSSMARSNVSTPGWYSSDDEEYDREVEREMFHVPIQHQGQNNSMSNRGRKVQRYHSESVYDRIQRAPSQQSNYSYGGGGDGSANMPGFPTCPPTPYLNRPVSPGKPPRSPKMSRRSNVSTPTTPTITVHEWGAMSEPVQPRAQTPVNPKPVFIVESEVKFTRDLSSFWYKPNASREETIAALRFQPMGSFIIRNSNSFPGAYGLAIKVNDSTTTEDSVRHFLIEPTKYGVRLRGSAVEPVFGSLSALVYAHSIEPLALPTTLALPSGDTVLPTSQAQSTTAHLLAQGAACQLLFLGAVGVECVTGDDAVKRGVGTVSGLTPPTVVSLRLSKQGLTLTDVFRQRFFRLHYPLNGISYAAVDHSNRTITYGNTTRKVFAVIARAPSASENTCVVLAELEEGQPANAIVAFFQRVIAWQT